MYRKKLSLGLIGLAILAGLIAYPFLPDILTIQVDSNNASSNEVPKYFGIALIPIAMMILHATRGNANKFVHASNRPEASLISIIVQFVLVGAQAMIILYGLDYNFDANVITKTGVGIVFVIVGNFLYRAKRSYGHGIKNRWTLSNSKVWSKTHHFSSIVFILAGALVVLISLFDKNSASTYTTGILIGSVILCYFASFLYYQKYKEEVNN
ncbi:MAG: SdpI family protein [Gorillibacterium sp.]|nr:SdpI family protein [Gorillibacterium sp.]